MLEIKGVSISPQKKFIFKKTLTFKVLLFNKILLYLQCKTITK